VRLVGLDFGSVNHQELIDKDIVVVENLSRLNTIPKWGARFYAVPPRVEGKSATVRAFAEVTAAEAS
jgi:kynurenine formamidase